MAKLSVGIIGCGPMGQSLAKGCTALQQVEIKAASDVNQELLDQFCSQFAAKGYADYREMIDSAGLDAAIVASPPFLHREMVEALADAGVHVFCEKPMAPTVADCDAMIEVCDNKDVKLMIGQVCRYHAIHSKVKDAVASGDFGKPLCMIVRRLGGGFGGIWRKEWRTKRAMSGGNLMEINAHEIDFMRWVCGEVARVGAVGVAHPDSKNDYPDAVVVTMHFRDGAIGSLHSSSISPISAYGGRVDCEGGSLHFPSIWGEGSGIHIKREDETSFIAASEIKVETPVTHELRVFFDSILSDETPPVTGKDGRAAVEIAQAAYLSIEEKRLVELPLR
ncbi:MAG: Gfo/Idh/MocA family oxidoreductase [Planctomycetes bacterium]|nr:Gfo/Idh/MocA family oxidoreductase [Planctomycetota bacterium]